MTAQTIYSARAFCEAYGVSRSTLTEMLARGDIKAKRIGRHIRISTDDAQEWYESLPDYEPAA